MYVCVYVRVYTYFILHIYVCIHIYYIVVWTIWLLYWMITVCFDLNKALRSAWTDELGCFCCCCCTHLCGSSCTQICAQPNDCVCASWARIYARRFCCTAGMSPPRWISDPPASNESESGSETVSVEFGVESFEALLIASVTLTHAQGHTGTHKHTCSQRGWTNLRSTSCRSKWQRIKFYAQISCDLRSIC